MRTHSPGKKPGTSQSIKKPLPDLLSLQRSVGNAAANRMLEQASSILVQRTPAGTNKELPPKPLPPKPLPPKPLLPAGQQQAIPDQEQIARIRQANVNWINDGRLVVHLNHSLERLRDIVEHFRLVDEVGMVEALADYLFHAYQDEDKEQLWKEGVYHDSAKSQIDSNKARGFTNHDDVIFFGSDSPGLSDQIHELIHVLSGHGGETPVTRINHGLNEGFTQYFTELACNATGVKVEEAYPKEVEFVRLLAEKYGTNMLFDAYFKPGGIETLIASMADTYAGYTERKKLKNESALPWSENSITVANAEGPVRDNLTKLNYQWLKLRVL